MLSALAFGAASIAAFFLGTSREVRAGLGLLFVILMVAAFVAKFLRDAPQRESEE